MNHKLEAEQHFPQKRQRIKLNTRLLPLEQSKRSLRPKVKRALE